MKPTSQTPPQWADRLLACYSRPELLDETQGDLHEAFIKIARDGDCGQHVGDLRSTLFDRFSSVMPANPTAQR